MFLDQDLVSYWKLENVNDSHGSNTLTNNGTGGAGAFTTDGKLNKCVRTWGAFETFLSRDNRIVSGAAYSVSCWFKVDSLFGGQVVISQTDDLAAVEFQIKYVDDGGVLLIVLGPWGGGQIDISPVAETWQHVAITIEEGAQCVYLNGVLVLDEFESGPFFTGQPGAFFNIGAGHGGGEMMEGYVDEVAIASRAWTAGEVALIYNGGDPLPYEDWATTGGGGGGSTVPVKTNAHNQRRR